MPHTPMSVLSASQKPRQTTANGAQRPSATANSAQPPARALPGSLGTTRSPDPEPPSPLSDLALESLLRLNRLQEGRRLTREQLRYAGSPSTDHLSTLVAQTGGQGSGSNRTQAFFAITEQGSHFCTELVAMARRVASVY